MESAECLFAVLHILLVGSELSRLPTSQHLFVVLFYSHTSTSLCLQPFTLMTQNDFFDQAYRERGTWVNVPLGDE